MTTTLTGEIWASHGDGWRMGIRCWHECNEAHIEIVYQEAEAGGWKDKSVISGVDWAAWDRLVQYGMFLFNMMEVDK